MSPGLHRRALTAAILLLQVLLISACAGVGGSSAPRDGLIMYREPVAQRGLTGKRRLEPITQIFVTGDAELAEQGSVQTRSGVIEGAGHTRSNTERDSRRIAQMIFQNAARRSTMVLEPAVFADLWSRMEEAGLFELTALPADKPPTHEPYFLVEARGRKTIYTRPSVTVVQPDDPGILQVKQWQRAKVAFFNFLNEQ